MTSKVPVIIPQELKATFLRETHEGLQQAKLALDKLRSNPKDMVALDDVGHFFHRIAGTAHSVEYPTLGRLAMVCENFAELVKVGKITDLPKVIETFTDGLTGVDEVVSEQKPANPPASTVHLADEAFMVHLSSRIMVVDDDPFSASFIDNFLRTAGFVSSFCTQPRQALEVLETDRPDLIILDVEMPGLDGFELCRLIRKHPAHGFTPIIFVTRKGDVEQRIRGLEVGGNDYIAKPFEPQELVARVRSHLHRLAALQDMVIRDGLTRCFNHKYFKMRLENEAERARRYGPPFSVAMLDIDHFKLVNDTWGHPAGDAVLIHLANVVAASIRSADALARYGGEEFGILLVEAASKEAEIITSRLRERIEREPFVLADGDDGTQAPSCNITVSIGVAEYRHGENTQALIQRADNALYAAKAGGRNQVRMAKVD